MIVYHVFNEYKGKEVTLNPSIPKNYLTEHGYENNTVKRVCVCDNLDSCLVAMSKNLMNTTVYVYYGYVEDAFIPSVLDVPDVFVTGEKWLLEPITMQFNSKQKILNATEVAGTYKIDGRKIELYKWLHQQEDLDDE